MKQHLDVDAELVRGGGGIFDVWVDGERIFCKHDVDRFPEDDEILQSIQG